MESINHTCSYYFIIKFFVYTWVGDSTKTGALFVDSSYTTNTSGGAEVTAMVSVDV